MNIKHKTLLPAMAFVVLLGLQVCVTTANGQAPAPVPAQTPGQAPGAAQAARPAGQRQGGPQANTPIQSDTTRSITTHFTLATKTPIAPDAKGFIRRWLVLEPINKPNRGNTVFIDSYLRTNFAMEYFPNQMTIMPKHGDKVKTVDQELKWYALDSKMFNFKLFRFSYAINKPQYSVLFWMVTVINCTEEIKNVRMSVGSNSASMWWLNGQEALLMSGDRRMVADDATSKRLTLKKGKNIVRGAVINGPGMSDFCVRFVDEKGQPVKNITITCE